MSGRRLARLAPLVLALSVSLTACGGDDGATSAGSSASESPTAGESSGTTSGSSEGDTLPITVTRKDGEFTPNGERVELGVDQTLVLTVTSDEAGEFHVHSTPEQEIEYDAGTTEHEITIDRPGVVEVESHDPASVVLQLEVR